MKTRLAYTAGVLFTAAVVLSCAGSSGRNAEPVGRQSNTGKQFALASHPENVSSTNADSSRSSLSGLIPLEMRTDWSRAGLIPGTAGLRADAVFDVTQESGATWDEKVQSAVQKAKVARRASIVYFPGGTYRLFRQVVLSDSSDGGIVFQGAGADSTVLEFEIGRDGNCFDMSGAEPGPKLALDTDLEKGGRSFSAAGLSNSFSKGDWVRLCEAGFPDADRENVGQTTQLAAVEGNCGIFDDQAAKTYLKSNELWIMKILAIRNIGFENFTLHRIDKKEASQDAYGCGINFKFNNAVNFWIKGVASLNTCRHHVVVNHSAHFEISGCYFAEACSRDENSYGYGVLMEVCTNNGLVENNIFEHLRHSMTVCEGVNTNVLAFNYSKNQTWTFHGLPNLFQGADLCLHGRYPYSNLFEQNIVEYAYADNSHGVNGPFNVFLRNQVYHGFKGSGKIRLFRAPNTAVFGNMSTSDKAAQVQYDQCEPFSDLFAFGKNGTDRHDHRGIRSLKFKAEDVRLPLASFFYKNKPDFLGSAFTWPAIGPSLDGQSLTQSIPAKERYLSEMKTVLKKPTTR